MGHDGGVSGKTGCTVCRGRSERAEPGAGYAAAGRPDKLRRTSRETRAAIKRVGEAMAYGGYCRSGWSRARLGYEGKPGSLGTRNVRGSPIQIRPGDKIRWAPLLPIQSAGAQCLLFAVYQLDIDHDPGYLEGVASLANMLNSKKGTVLVSRSSLPPRRTHKRPPAHS